MKTVKRKLFKDVLAENKILTDEQLIILEKKSRHTSIAYSKLAIKNGYLTEDELSKILIKYWKEIKIGDLLVQLGLVTVEDIDKVISLKRPDEKLGEAMINHGVLNESDFIEVLSNQLGIPRMNPLLEAIDVNLLNKFPESFLKNAYVIPLFEIDGILTCIMANPLDTELIDAIKLRLDLKDVHPTIASREDILSSLDRIFSPTFKDLCNESELENLKKMPLEAGQSDIKYTNISHMIFDDIVRDAVKSGVSDIHFDIDKQRFIVNFRIDGMLFHKTDLPLDLAPTLMSYIKVLGRLDISQKRIPQDGKIVFKLLGREIDLRLATYPSEFGENMTIRILDRQKALVDFKSLGFNKQHLNRYQQILDYPSGLVLVTGPTGSGKTTTLYASVNYLKDKGKRIISVEDPVEYTISGITQANYRPGIGVNYDTILKAMMRQAPDVILVGEIRDRMAAEATIQSALTGHKVFTTFHTEDSVGALLRLMDMGIETFLISSTVVCIIAQRLVRRICPRCIEPTTINTGDVSKFAILDLKDHSTEFFRGKGCSFCRNTGYKGRIGLYELLILNDLIRDAILEHKTSGQIREIIYDSSNMITMIEDGVYKSLKGITTLEEVLRVCYNLKSDLLPQRTVDEVIRLCEGDNLPDSKVINTSALAQKPQ